MLDLRKTIRDGLFVAALITQTYAAEDHQADPLENLKRLAEVACSLYDQEVQHLPKKRRVENVPFTPQTTHPLPIMNYVQNKGTQIPAPRFLNQQLITQQLLNQHFLNQRISLLFPYQSFMAPLPQNIYSSVQTTRNKQKPTPSKKTRDFKYRIGEEAFDIAREHHAGQGGQQKTRFRHTGLLVAQLCVEYQNLIKSRGLNSEIKPETKKELGKFLAALYLRGDANLLWKRYLRIEDFLQEYSVQRGKLTKNYVSHLPENSKTQADIKIAALKAAAFLGNQFSIDKMAELGYSLVEEEKLNANNLEDIISRLKNILDTFIFAPKNEIACGL